MQKIKTFFSVAMIVLGLVALPLATVAQAKVDINTAKSETCGGQGGRVAGEDDPERKIKKGDCVGGQGISSVFETVTNILLFLVGAVAVIMIVIAGFRFVTANGDQNAVTGARNTILYAVIGIIVAFLAYAAVRFVVRQF